MYNPVSSLKISRGYRVVSSWLASDSLTIRASLNAFTSALDYISRAFVEFLISPYLVFGLGDYLFGLWRIIWRLIGYMMAASGRSSQALKFSISNLQSSADFQEKRQNIGSAIAVWLLFLPIVLLVGGLLAWLLPIILDVPVEYLWGARIAIGLLMVGVILLSLADMPRAVLQGENLGYKRMGLSSALVIASGGLMVLAVYLDLGIPGLAGANLVITILTGVLFFRVVRSHIPWFGIAKPTRDMVRWFFGLSWWFLIWKFVMQLMMEGDVVLLGVFGSVEMVTIYTFMKYVPDLIIKLIATAVFGMSPGFGGIIGSGNFKKSISVRNEIMILTWLMATATGAAVLLLNHTFVQLWVGDRYDAGAYETLLIVIMVAQFSLIRIDANVIDLTLDIRRKVLLGVLSVAFSVIFVVLLMDYFNAGIVGMCLGFILGRAILSVVYPWQVGRYLGFSFFSQFKGVLRPTLTTGLLFVLMFVGREYIMINSWLGLILAAISAGIVLTVLAFALGLKPGQRKRILKRVRVMVRSGMVN